MYRIDEGDDTYVSRFVSWEESSQEDIGNIVEGKRQCHGIYKHRSIDMV